MYSLQFFTTYISVQLMFFFLVLYINKKNPKHILFLCHIVVGVFFLLLTTLLFSSIATYRKYCIPSLFYLSRWKREREREREKVCKKTLW